MRHIVLMLACIKAHCKAMFISPRNSSDGQHSLFTATACDLIYYARPFGPLVDTWLLERLTMRAVEAADAGTWLLSNGPRFGSACTFKEARWEPVIVLHTSGSTGRQKPIIIRHGSIAITDRQRKPWAPKSTRMRSRVWQWDCWADNCTQQLLCPPLFHVAGRHMYSYEPPPRNLARTSRDAADTHLAAECSIAHRNTPSLGHAGAAFIWK
ncbi:hypothetical protein GE09DRAFT_1158751 [Coniochaeta sp. 2T2.1]|nr:hypothetical protein GE09DRAFT_1158751 [Coniochaeta sp. 2T2.1]